LTQQATPAIAQGIELALSSGSSVTIVEIDGDPDQAQRFEAPAMGNPQAQKDEVAQAEAAAADYALSLRADDPEVDLLAAIDVAARGLQGSGTLVVVDPGLATAGAVTFQDSNIFATDGAAIAAQLKASGQLPDLSGITVFFVGIGDTVAPQEDVTPAARAAIEDVWTSVAREAGASCVAVDKTPITGEPAASLPPVTTIDIPDYAALELTPGQELKLGSDVIRFRDNSNEFVDPQAVREALEPIAASIKAASGSVLLVGTTSSAGTREGQLERSTGRAEAVKGVLVDLGVDGSRIVAQGVGTEHPQHVPDVGPNGQELPLPAAQNRAVFLTLQPS
jgi:outer membrane protein OmpA-like peptidoglycan-associated protein